MTHEPTTGGEGTVVDSESRRGQVRGDYDKTVDVLVIGSGGGGMTAALAAADAGLETLVVEKGEQFGGSTALVGRWHLGSGCARPAPRGVLAGTGRRRGVPAGDHRGSGQ